MSGNSLLWWATVRQNGAEALERDADRRPCRRRTGAGRPRGRTPTAIRVGLAAVAAALVAGATGTPAFARPAAAAPPPSSVGAWSPVYAWPNIGIHLHLLPNGKVLSWDEGKRPAADSPGSVDAYVVDVPAGQPPGAAVKAPNGKTDLFCSGHTFLPDGRLFVSGGRGAGSGTGSGVADVNIFDYRTNGWTTTAGYAAQYARWYASTLALPTGEVLLLGGTLKTQKDRNPLPQVWQTGQGGLRDLTTALLKLNPYPRIYVAPDGRVVQVGDEPVTRFLDTSGTGKWTTGPSRKFGVRLAGTSAMYADGKVLTVGGGKYNVVPTKTAEVLDLDAPAPAWRYTAPMAYARKHANVTVLPDGKVLVTGGSGSAAFNDGAGAVLAAEAVGPGDRRLDHAGEHAGQAGLPLDRDPAAGRPRAVGRRHRGDERGRQQPRRGDLLAALPVQRPAADHHVRPRERRLRADVRGADPGRGRDRQGEAGPPVLGDALLQP